MKRFLLLSLIAISLLSSFTVMAQTTIATMKTANATAKVKVFWFGTGKVTSNGNTLSVNVEATVTVQNGTVNLVTTGDVQLTEITCSNNGLTAIDVTKCVDLTSLVCDRNQLTNLDITNSKKIITIDCGDNQLSTLNLANAIALEYLYIDGNKFSTIDFSKSPKIRILDVGGNSFTSFGVSNLASLEYLYVYNNKLTILPIVNCPKLSFLACANNQFATLDFSTITSLETILCSNNLLTSLKLPQTTILESVSCNNNLLKTIDVSKCTGLLDLYCYNNQITSLDVSKCTKLTNFSANGQKVTLAQATATNGALSINYPIYYNGAVVTGITPSNNGTYASNQVSWTGLTGTSGTVNFTFSLNNGNFAGTVTQPWVAAQSTPVEEQPSESVKIFTNASYINIHGLIANQHVSVYGVTGTLIYQTVSTSNRVDIDMPAGIYIVKIDNQSFKVVKH